MSKSNYLLTSKINDILYIDLLSLKKEYYKLLKLNIFPLPPRNGDAIEMIKYFKRRIISDETKIGIYQNITPSEAANRIATDLVIINGIIQLIEERLEPKSSIITVRLGITHEKGKGDFTINGNEGEAFNVAPSFLKPKLRATLKKWKEIGIDQLKYILINEEAFVGNSIKNLKKIVKVRNWIE